MCQGAEVLGRTRARQRCDRVCKVDTPPDFPVKGNLSNGCIIILGAIGNRITRSVFEPIYFKLGKPWINDSPVFISTQFAKASP